MSLIFNMFCAIEIRTLSLTWPISNPILLSPAYTYMKHCAEYMLFSEVPGTRLHKAFRRCLRVELTSDTHSALGVLVEVSKIHVLKKAVQK